MVDTQLTPPRSAAPVLMIVHSYYEEDPRVRREAETLRAAGHPVTVIGLRRPGNAPTDTVEGVELYRLDVQRHQGAGLSVYLREYLSFFWRSAWMAGRLHRRRRFRLVQVHSLPDFLALAALPLRLAGVPLLLDLHEAMPEFFRTRFGGAANPLVDRLLHLQERLAIAISARTLVVSEAMRHRLVRLGVRPDKVVVVINSPSLDRFDKDAHPVRAFCQDGRLRLVYAGALTPIYELDVTLRAIASVVARRPEIDIAFDVYGRGDSEPALRALAAELGLGRHVVFHGRIPIEDVPGVVAGADIGIAPTRLDPFTAMSLSTKIFEYAAMGKPVVASRLPMLERTFPAGTVAAYEPGDPHSLAAALLGLVDDADVRRRRVNDTLEIVRRTSWEAVSRPYVALVGELTHAG
jgi:glycosyltransferase involved in cell wall biosynthesis